MTIEQIISNKDIQQVLHFTTTKGLLGILASGAVKSRSRLPEDKYLECIYEPNCSVRYDSAWLDYVNLSIESINKSFFQICSSKWHQDSEWCILSFNPTVMTHDGVFFATTNNRYTGVRQGDGPRGLLALYAPTITQWSGRVVQRRANLLPSEPTCPQAEVLYPRELSLAYAQKIIFSTDQQIENYMGQLAAFDMSEIPWEVIPSCFY